MLGVGSAGPSAFSQYTPLPPEMSLSKFAGFKTWFATYRSSILIGGGAGIAVVIILMIVMRSSGSTPATRSIDAGVPGDATELKMTPIDAPAPTPDAATTKRSGKGSGSAAH